MMTYPLRPMEVQHDAAAVRTDQQKNRLVHSGVGYTTPSGRPS
jgi:hypothetical protein